jgi:hypothetical protein
MTLDPRACGRHAAILGFLLAAGPALGATHYASGGGKGGACTEDKPCTIAKCVGKVRAGDTCEVMPGTYRPWRINASANCKAAKPCTLKSQKPLGAELVIEAEGPEVVSVMGNHWVIDGFLVRIKAQRTFTKVSAERGFTWINHRVEVRPGVGGEVLSTNGTDDVTVTGNWVHHVPGCQNGGGAYGPCGRHARCDFDTGNGDAFVFLGDGKLTPTSGLVFSRNDYGHWQNPMRVRNFANVVYSRNRCVNATNHGCIEANDVHGLVMENNVADIDTGEDCRDEILQSSLFDSYCFTDVVIRNNTVVGHGIGWEQQLDVLAPNAGADSGCKDRVLPEVGSDGTWYDYLRIYNNIIYDGKPSSGAAGIILNTGQAAAAPSPCCFSDYNLVHSPSGKRIGIDLDKPFVTWAEWQAHGKDLHGLNVAPEFVSYCNEFGSPGCHDYRPASASAPQVDTGMGTKDLPCPADDFDGNPRSDGKCDIGAHEFQKTGSPAP